MNDVRPGIALGLPASCFLFFATACGPVEPAGTPGALKEGGFTFCEDANAGCSGSAAIPRRLAVGSTFSIQFSDSSGDVELSSPDKTRLELITTHGDGSVGFRVLAGGSASVEARMTSTNKLLDFVRLNLVDIAILGVRFCPRAFNAITAPGGNFFPSQCGGAGQETSNIDISLSFALAPTFCSSPIDGDANALAGRLPYEWTVNDGATANLEMFVSSERDCATIGALTPGEASVTITAGNASSVVTFAVTP